MHIIKNRIHVLIGIVIINLIILILASTYLNHNLIFFSLQFRLFEFLIGSIIAEIEKKNYNFSRTTNNFLLIFGSGLIFFSIIFFRGANIQWPSLYTLLPVTGAAMLILSKINVSKFNFLLTYTYKILIFIGLISYSLYLFHYPILIIAKKYNQGIDLLISQKIILLVLTFIISIISFELFEKNFKRTFIRAKNISIIFFCSLLISLKFFDQKIINFYYLATDKINLTTNSFKTNEPQPWGFLLNNKYCFNLFEDFCKVEKPGGDISNRDIILVGDSILSSMSSEIFLQLKDTNNLIFTNIALYGYFPNYEKERHSDLELRKNLERVIKNRYKYIDKNNNIIVISGRFRPTTNDEIIISDILLPIQNILEKNKVVLILPLPFNDKLDSRNIKGSNYIISKKQYLKHTEKFINYVKAINNKNFYIVDSYNLLCQDNEDYCMTKINNELIYYDGLHTNNNGSKIIVNELKKIILEINNKN